jgi:hypothetical protein
MVGSGLEFEGPWEETVGWRTCCRGVVKEVEGLKRWEGGMRFGGMNLEGNRKALWVLW